MIKVGHFFAAGIPIGEKAPGKTPALFLCRKDYRLLKIFCEIFTLILLC